MPEREALAGQFGLIPHWAKDEKFGSHTFNARSETAATLPNFRDACRKGQRCIIPANAICESDWRSGKAIPTRTTRADGALMGIAKLWSWWKSPAGQAVQSFTMLTINADEHGRGAQPLFGAMRAGGPAREHAATPELGRDCEQQGHHGQPCASRQLRPPLRRLAGPPVRFVRIRPLCGRLSSAQQAVMEALLVVDTNTLKTPFANLCSTPGRPSRKNPNALIDRYQRLQGLPNQATALQLIADSKILHWANEARRLNALELRENVTPRRRTLLMAVINDARGQTIDELTQMLLGLTRKVECKSELRLTQ